MTKKHLTTSAALAALLIAAGAAASAAEVTLRIADSFPIGHFLSEGMTKPWMEKVKEKSGGEIDFEYFPAEQLGKAKDMLSLTKTGVVDIGYVGITYTADKLPLSAVGELPEAFNAACWGTKAYWELIKPGAILDQNEIAPNGVRTLFVNVLSPYQIFTASRELTGIDAVKGLKLRATGGAKELAVERLGATPIAMPAPEMREALTRGTVDGILLANSSVPPYGLIPVLKYGTQDMNFGSFVITYMINQDKWDSLSPEVQAILTSASEEIIPEACAMGEERNISDMKDMAAGGIQFVDLPEADVARVEEVMATIGADWAKDLDSRGRPGTEVLEAFRAALERHKPQ